MKLLEAKLKEWKMPALYSKEDRISKEYKTERFDQILMQLLEKKFGYDTFIKKVYKDLIPAEHIEPTRSRKKAM